MTEHLSFVKPTKNMEEDYYEYVNEWRQFGEKMIPSTLRHFPNDYDQLLQKLKRDALEEQPEGRVPATTIFLINKSDKIIGACNIRHRLNENLSKTEGNIGYGVRPTERGRGYATEILRHALNYLKSLGVERALVTCNANNIASEKVIIKNGGVEDDHYIEDDGNIVKRFWIDL